MSTSEAQWKLKVDSLLERLRVRDQQHRDLKHEARGLRVAVAKLETVLITKHDQFKQLAENYRGARAEIRHHKETIEEYHGVQTRLHDLLTGVANALKGEPHELVMHSWHDLPELAAATIKLCRLAEQWLENTTDDSSDQPLIEGVQAWRDAQPKNV